MGFIPWTAISKTGFWPSIPHYSIRLAFTHTVQLIDTNPRVSVVRDYHCLLLFFQARPLADGLGHCCGARTACA